MLFASLLTLALAAMSIAAPAPAPVELEDRAVPGLQRVSASLSAAVDAYQANPSSFDLRVRLCTVITGLTASQRAASLRIGFNTNSVQCPTISDQLDNIQAGLGRAYQQYTRNPNSPTVIASLCAITTQLTQGQRTRVTAIGADISGVQCLTIKQQLDAVQDGLGQAYQQYTRNTNAQTTAALCAITTQLTQAQRNRIAALNISINVQCPVNVAQRLDAISPGFSSVYNALVAAPNNFANQLAFCTVIDRLNFRQTAQVQALNLNTNNLQCTNVLLRNRLNNIFLGFGDAWYKWYNNKNAANLTALCGITAQLSRQQKNRLLNLGVDVATFNCPAN